jgi:hypothetical protein
VGIVRKVENLYEMFFDMPSLAWSFAFLVVLCNIQWCEVFEFTGTIREKDIENRFPLKCGWDVEA